MRYTLLFSIPLLILAATSCSKNKFSSNPVLKFKSVNTTQLFNQELLIFTLSFTDGSPNFGTSDSSVFVQEIVPDCSQSAFSAYYALPSFPVKKNASGDITVTYGYNLSGSGYSSISPQCQQNDTAIFRFVLRDLNNHSSDTVSSPPIILYYP